MNQSNGDFSHHAQQQPHGSCCAYWILRLPNLVSLAIENCADNSKGENKMTNYAYYERSSEDQQNYEDALDAENTAYGKCERCKEIGSFFRRDIGGAESYTPWISDCCEREMLCDIVPNPEYDEDEDEN